MHAIPLRDELPYSGLFSRVGMICVTSPHVTSICTGLDYGLDYGLSWTVNSVLVLVFKEDFECLIAQ